MVLIRFGVERPSRGKESVGRQTSRSNERRSMGIQSDLHIVTSIEGTIGGGLAHELDFDGLVQVHLTLKSSIGVLGLYESSVLNVNRNVTPIKGGTYAVTDNLGIVHNTDVGDYELFMYSFATSTGASQAPTSTNPTPDGALTNPSAMSNTDLSTK